MNGRLLVCLLLRIDSTIFKIDLQADADDNKQQQSCVQYFSSRVSTVEDRRKCEGLLFSLATYILCSISVFSLSMIFSK